jgi:hypothetical protein
LDGAYEDQSTVKGIAPKEQSYVISTNDYYKY